MDPTATATLETDQRRSDPSTVTNGTTPLAPAKPDAHLLVEIEPLIQRMAVYLPNMDLSVVTRAYLVAHAAHEGQYRSSGDAYIRHPFAVAHILVDLRLDPACIAAALLHDVPEDTEVTLDSIHRMFGEEIGKIVDGVTKLTAIEGRTKEEAQAGTYRKMFIAMADDPRVVLIKLADRLHNIRTLDAVEPDKQQRVARETLEIYAPLAHRLGIWQFKWELEDKAFRYLHPDKYRAIGRQLSLRRDAREKIVERVMKGLRQELAKEGIEAEITGRPKHIYSIYRKMEKKGVSLDQIYDQLAVRVIVKTVGECYRVLGIVHSTWTPVLNEFDDYIAVPKESMYQSLHTTVIIPGGQPCEIQIRTFEMHEVAEHGIAAHWRYKEGMRPAEASFDAKLHWLRNLLSWRQELGDAEEFLQAVKADVLEEQVYVFTPKGMIIDLAQGSTPIDFAYRIHTEVGNRCVGAKINGKQVGLDYRLQNGDMVQIQTTKAERGPSRDWLEVVKTSNARNHIRRWFRRQNRDGNIDAGRDMLDRELKKLGLVVAFDDVASICGFKDVDEMFYAIGIGDQHPRELLRRVLKERQEQQTTTEPDPLTQIPAFAPRAMEAPKIGIQVRGASDIYTRLAKCCNPIEGEAVVGFVTRGKGLTIHRADCFNIINERDRARLMDVSWGTSDVRKCYPVPVRIEAWDRVGLWRDVADTIADAGVNIGKVQQIDNRHSERATLIATVMVDSLSQLSDILDRLNRVRDVIEARRDRVATA
jgi:GTP diphosphokinase / guanosine-3',5'-bis(diphosphate) 3'-diphosphatase